MRMLIILLIIAVVESHTKFVSDVLERVVLDVVRLYLVRVRTFFFANFGLSNYLYTNGTFW